MSGILESVFLQKAAGITKTSTEGQEALQRTKTTVDKLKAMNAKLAALGEEFEIETTFDPEDFEKARSACVHSSDMLFAQARRAKSIGQLFDKFDVDHDRNISFNEFEASDMNVTPIHLTSSWTGLCAHPRGQQVHA